MKSLIRWFAAIAVVGLVSASPAGTHPAPRHCARTYTLKMFERAARATYSGTDLPSKGAYGRLWRYERCQRRPGDRARAQTYWKGQHDAWAKRRHPPAPVLPPTTGTALASWYYDQGSTASGFHATYGVAVCGSGGGPCVPFGTKIEFCFNGCVVATAIDHGPYVAGRWFDLGESTAQAIGFSGVQEVRYRIL